MDCDLLVYGGTSAGVIAAVTAARRGHRVLLVEPGRHLGGMTSGGLGWTDFGNKAAVGGMARSFYVRIGDHYEQTLGTRQFSEQSHRDAGHASDGACFVFEPSVAEAIFGAMLAETGENVRVLREHRVDAVRVEDGRIVRVQLEHAPSGDFNEPGERVHEHVSVTPRFCLDCSYEGDLLARAGCAYRVGREANGEYGETLNGIPADTPKHQIGVPVDPYHSLGDADSGLLPLVQAGDLGTPGDGDASVQAYNFRLCLTRRDDLRVPWQDRAAPDYDAGRYELLRRYLNAVAERDGGTSIRRHLIISGLPNGKTDINNNGGVSTDFIGSNHAYPDADYAARGRIWREHVAYQWGLMQFLATAPDLPSQKVVQDEVNALGLCRDEFADTGGWPHQLYVREARRLLGQDVMTEHHCRGEAVVEDPIALAAYTMDSHNCRRLAIDGLAKNEGDVQVPPTDPYPVGYRALLPRDGATRNLLVPVCVSATHIAFGSIRMEPVFMALAQSAALAACECLGADVPADELPYDKLRPSLAEAGQVLAWPPSEESITKKP